MGAQFLILKTEEVSRVVIRSMQKKKFHTTIPPWLALACFIKGMMPNVFQTVFYRILRLLYLRQIRKVP